MTPEVRLARALDIAESFSRDQIYSMDDFDQEHLEGLQYGLKTFEGLNFKQVY